jgi:hypothetical protein
VRSKAGVHNNEAVGVAQDEKKREDSWRVSWNCQPVTGCQLHHANQVTRPDACNAGQVEKEGVGIGDAARAQEHGELRGGKEPRRHSSSISASLPPTPPAPLDPRAPAASMLQQWCWSPAAGPLLLHRRQECSPERPRRVIAPPAEGKCRALPTAAVGACTASLRDEGPHEGSGASGGVQAAGKRSSSSSSSSSSRGGGGIASVLLDLSHEPE